MSVNTSTVFPDPTRTLLIPIVKPCLSQVWRQLEWCFEAALSKKGKAFLIGGIGIMGSFGSSSSSTTIWTQEWTVGFVLVLIIGQNQKLFLSTTSALCGSNSGRSSSLNCTQSKCCRSLCHTLVEWSSSNSIKMFFIATVWQQMCTCLSFLIRDMVVGKCSDEILLQLSSYDYQLFYVVMLK